MQFTLKKSKDTLFFFSSVLFLEGDQWCLKCKETRHWMLICHFLWWAGLLQFSFSSGFQISVKPRAPSDIPSAARRVCLAPVSPSTHSRILRPEPSPSFSPGTWRSGRALAVWRVPAESPPWCGLATGGRSSARVETDVDRPCSDASCGCDAIGRLSTQAFSFLISFHRESRGNV